MGKDKKADKTSSVYDKPNTPLNPCNIEYLAIQGAGGKGAAYLGALTAIEHLKILETTDGKNEKKEVQKFKQLKGISGTSAGTITALMLSLGYTARETNEMVIKNPLFLLALGEKSQVSRYRAYKSTEDKTDKKPPEIGFTFPGYKKNIKVKIKKELAKAIQRTGVEILEDKYTLSSKIIEGFEGTKNPNQLIQLLKKTRPGFISPLKVALFQGILKSLGNEETIINITDELYNVCFEEFEAFKRRSKIIDTVTFGTYSLMFSKIEESLDDLFEGWETEKGKNAIGYLIFVLIILISFYFAIYVVEYLLDTRKDDCTETKQGKRKFKETMGTLKMYMKFLWHSNIPKTPIVTSLWKESKKLLDFSFNSTINNIDAFNNVSSSKDKNLFTVISSFATKINLLTKGDLSGLINSITIEFGRIFPAIIKPISTILSEGGLLDGCRVRFIIAKLIYEKVEVIIDSKDDFIFKRRKKDLTKEVLENIEIIFHQDKKIKSLKALKKELENYTKEYIGFQNDKLLSLKDITEFLAKLSKFIYVNFNSDKSDNTTILNFINDLSLEEKALKKAGDKIDGINQLMGLYEMREHLKIIEKYYNFEEHKKIFNHYFVVCAANITSGVSAYFNEALTPDFSIVEAVGMSMNIPGLWKPVAVNYKPKANKGRRLLGGITDEDFYNKYYYGWFVDGGINENIPLFAFNGYPSKDELLKDGVATRSPEEMVMFNEEFPKGKILGISNFGGQFKDKKSYKGGQLAKDEKEQALCREEAFDISKKSFLSVGGDIFSSFFEYSYKLRGFELEPYKSHILTVDYGFMGMFDFVANIDELIRVETKNIENTMLFFDKEDESTYPKVINNLKDLDKKGRRKWKKSSTNHKKLYKKPFFTDFGK
jgi:predicted acylesterase/phospholipase RssA